MADYAEFTVCIKTGIWTSDSPVVTAVAMEPPDESMSPCRRRMFRSTSGQDETRADTFKTTTVDLADIYHPQTGLDALVDATKTGGERLSYQNMFFSDIETHTDDIKKADSFNQFTRVMMSNKLRKKADLQRATVSLDRTRRSMTFPVPMEDSKVLYVEDRRPRMGLDRSRTPVQPLDAMVNPPEDIETLDKEDRKCDVKFRSPLVRACADLFDGSVWTSSAVAEAST